MNAELPTALGAMRCQTWEMIVTVKMKAKKKTANLSQTRAASTLPRLNFLNKDPQAPPRAENGRALPPFSASDEAKYFERACTTAGSGGAQSSARSEVYEDLGRGVGEFAGTALKKERTEGTA